jgi:hypothetical protein
MVKNMTEIGLSGVKLNKHYFAFLVDYFGTRSVAALAHLSLCLHQQKDGQQLKSGENYVFASQNMREAIVIGSAIWLGEN